MPSAREQIRIEFQGRGWQNLRILNLGPADFSQQYIFGVFESFCKRLKDLLDMFDNIRTFGQLFSTKLESLLAEEILVNDRIAFEQVVDGGKNF